MFYKVNESYRLVGWRNLPTGVLDVQKDSVSFLPRDEYGLLLHMNGQEEIDVRKLTAKQQEVIQRFLDDKMIDAADHPFTETPKPLYRFRDHARIDSVQWSITGKCNFNCRHCLMSAPQNCSADLTTGQCLDIVRQLAECGVRSIAITGGEPLIRSDLPDLIKACSDAGIRIAEVYTNGALLSPQMLDQFTRMGQRPGIQISYDGIGWHDWVRGIDGAQQIAEKAIRTAHEAGLRVSAAMALFKDNVPVIRETIRRLASMSVGRVKISPMMELGLWGENHADKTLSDEEFLQAILGYIPYFIEDGKPCWLTMGGYLFYDRDTDLFSSTEAKNPDSPTPLYPCQGVVLNPYISAEGTILPCMSFADDPAYQDYPNLLETPLIQILQDSIWLKTSRTTIQDVFEHNAECMQCEERGKHCALSCRSCAKPGFCDIDRTTCAFVKNGWFRKVQEAVETAGGKYVLY